jgi:sterol desaturase/sphingolipid hydroxylase (fatty acid hydroxylase superfamily)
MNNIKKQPTTTKKSSSSTSSFFYLLQTSFIKTITHKLLIYTFDLKSPTLGHTHFYKPFLFFILFIAKSFLFEILFDFFHYSTHRIFHLSPFLYKNVHKTHHIFTNPTPYSTFHMSILDLLFSYSFPLSISIYILPFNFSLLEFYLLITYLTYQEIGGHIGKIMTPTSSFPQFIWLPKLLGIELYAEDHFLHHNIIKCNYSKRFNIWDRVFNTYQPYKS